MSQHVAILGNSTESMVRFRGPLIRDLRAAGHTVTALCPVGSSAMTAELEALGARHVAVPMARASINPLGELGILRQLIHELRELQPDCLFTYFLKPVIWGSLAGWLVGVPRRVAMIEGLGYAFSEPPPGARVTFKKRLAQAAVIALLRPALACCHQLVVLNRNDTDLIRRHRLKSVEHTHRLDGIGVDLGHYAALPPRQDPVTFTLAARLIPEKGVRTFVEVARRLRRHDPGSRWVLLGGLDESSGAITRAELDAWVADGDVEWRGLVHDVRPEFAQTSVFVLPSSYGEGLPRSIMEAMACARPVITSTVAGCRDAVTPEVSGLLVPPHDPDALAVACERFLDAPAEVARMGRAAREEAERRYDVHRQNAVLIDLLLGESASVAERVEAEA
jgi:glycosyltransferase involved in cell wall biosynthesis